MNGSKLRGYAVLLQRIMDNHPESFNKESKLLSAYFTKPTTLPIRVKLIDKSLSEILIHEVERYYDVDR